MFTTLQQQYFLKYYYGYYTGKLDGLKGNMTKNATVAFQKAHGLTPDGVWGALTNAKAIQCAKQLQKKLNEKGANLLVDGIIGKSTVTAIKQFQKVKGLVADGIAGALTWAKLNASLEWSDIKYFKRDEFRCPCGKCGGFPVEPNLKMVKLMDDIRTTYSKPITITCGVRCKSYNKRVGGITNSAHLQGKAADFYIKAQNDTASGRNAVVKKAYNLGAKYSYANTTGMGNAVHVNI